MKDKERANRYASNKLTGFAKRRAYEGYLAGLRMGRKLEREAKPKLKYPSDDSYHDHEMGDYP